MPSRPLSLAAGVGAVALLGYVVVAGTHGTKAQDICERGFARSHRLDAAHYYPIARQVFERAGVPWQDRHNWRIDHVRPVCLAGTWDLSNLQLQRPDEAAAKDRLEWKACRDVCQGRVSLTEARSWFADWRANMYRLAR